MNKALWLTVVTNNVSSLSQTDLVFFLVTKAAPYFGPFLLSHSLQQQYLQCWSQAQGPNAEQTKQQLSPAIGSISRESVHNFKPKCIHGWIHIYSLLLGITLQHIYLDVEPQDVHTCHFNTSKLAHRPYIFLRYRSIFHIEVHYINSTLNHHCGYNNN